MHPNPAFHDATDIQNLAFARTRSFGILSVNGETGPYAAHVPFLLSEDGSSADLHLVRSNPVARALVQPVSAVLAVSGPDGYISPDWYGDDEHVPTWNYVAVHLRGRLEALPDDALRGLLERQSAAFEARLAPKPPWRLEDMEDEYGGLDRMMRMIQPVRLSVETVDGTWKLAQNKPEMARSCATRNVESGFGQELSELADLMRNVGNA